MMKTMMMVMITIVTAPSCPCRGWQKSPWEQIRICVCQRWCLWPVYLYFYWYLCLFVSFRDDACQLSHTLESVKFQEKHKVKVQNSLRYWGKHWFFGKIVVESNESGCWPQADGSRMEERRIQLLPWRRQGNLRGRRQRAQGFPSCISRITFTFWTRLCSTFTFWDKWTFTFFSAAYLTPSAAISCMLSMDPWGNCGADPTSMTVRELIIRLIVSTFTRFVTSSTGTCLNIWVLGDVEW